MTTKIYVGTCSWVEKSLVGSFHSKDIRPADMISFYSTQFPVVEVDSSFYHMPSARNASLWATRTPPEFRFDLRIAFVNVDEPQVDIKSSASPAITRTVLYWRFYL